MGNAGFLSSTAILSKELEVRPLRKILEALERPVLWRLGAVPGLLASQTVTASGLCGFGDLGFRVWGLGFRV